MRDNGYDTVGFHGALLTDAVWGFDYGFREYTFSPNDDQFLLASEYLKKRSRTPFFLFVHTYVVHRPYSYESVFGDRARRPPTLNGMDFANDRFDGLEVTPVDPEAPLYGWRPTTDEIEYFKTVYDGGVCAADQLLEGLVETILSESLYEDTMIVVTAEALDDGLTRRFIPAMGLEAHAEQLLAEGKATAELPFTEEASEELMESLRSLGYL